MPAPATRKSLDVGLAPRLNTTPVGTPCPVDPPAPLQDRREERTAAQLGDRQIDVTGLGRQQPWPAAVALVRTRLAALVHAGADHLGRFDLDELLQHETHGLADQIDTVTGTERVQQLGNGRL